MKQQDIENRIRVLFSRFVTEVEGNKAQDLLDTNLISENVALPILAKLFDCPNLINANHEGNRNFPGIDLIDKEKRIAFQVTATPTLDKIKTTIKTVLKHSLQYSFDQLYIYVISKKQGTYSTNAVNDLIQGKFNFDPQKHVIDFSDLLEICSQKDIYDQQFILERLEDQFGNQNILPRGLSKQTQAAEEIASNLLEIDFPEYLYVADLDIDKKAVTEEGKKQNLFNYKRHLQPREIARVALELKSLRFASDWVCYENKVFTFHDLEQDDCPLREIIDIGTIVPLHSYEIYDVSDSYEAIFKDLLNVTLKQELYHRGVQWQNSEKLYFFTDDKKSPDSMERKEEWIGKKKDSRVVFKTILKSEKSKAPGEVLHHKHFAFGIKFIRVGDSWYVALRPDWFFSSNGYKPSYFNYDQVTKQKKLEKNIAIYNHVRFITYFLKNQGTGDLFSQNNHHKFLKYGDLVIFEADYPLNDNVWLNHEPKEKVTAMKDQIGLF